MQASRILIVEDESIVAEDMRQSLLELGYLVPAVAYNGKQAIAKAAEINPDVILMDIVLPGDIDGIEAAGQIRSRQNIPIIFVTAYADDDLLARAKVIQPFGYVLKPFVQRELHSNIEIALYKHRAEIQLVESKTKLEKALVDLNLAQEKMVQKERLAAVGHLSAGLAHDFNNILASIILNADLVLRSDSLSPQDQRRIKSIRKQGRYAKDLTQKMLDFGEKSLLRSQELCLDDFMDAFVAEIATALPQNIALHTRSSGVRGFVSADPDRIVQALRNLVSNARDAMPKGGELFIEWTVVDADPPDFSGKWARVTVIDTGFGIAPDVLPRIFEPFFTTCAPLRTGLGLSQVLGIVKQHGGRIEVESSEGEGTTFTIYLPATCEPEYDEKATAGSLLPLGTGQNVLVISDNVTVREALVGSLEMLNYKCRTVSGCGEVLQLPDSELDGISLLLIDQNPFDKRASHCVRALAQLGIRVLLLIDQLPDESMMALRAGGDLNWLAKPIDLEGLANGLAKLLG